MDPTYLVYEPPKPIRIEEKPIYESKIIRYKVSLEKQKR